MFCAVVGDPVAHSRSPAMHKAAYAELGLDWNYFALPVPAALFEDIVRGLPRSGYAGVNVTIPHKLAALSLADVASPVARAIGAANMLTFRDGRIEADNTDAGGLLDAIGEPVRQMRAQVLGAGGAGRAAAWALADAGADGVTVWNRTPEKAEALAEEIRMAGAGFRKRVDLLVNATSVGLDPSDDADALNQLGLADREPPPLVVDLVYRNGGITPVQAWAERGGASFVGGLEVLVRQGARSFESWTGRPAPLAAMRAAATAA